MWIRDPTFDSVVLKSEFPDDLEIQYDASQLDKIELVNNHPTHLQYNFEARKDQLMVFSEMYFPKGWHVTIDNEKADFFPINYVLRGLKVPHGNHTIDFIFDPPVIKKGAYIRLITLLVFTAIISFFGYHRFKFKSN